MQRSSEPSAILRPKACIIAAENFYWAVILPAINFVIRLLNKKRTLNGNESQVLVIFTPEQMGKGLNAS